MSIILPTTKVKAQRGTRRFWLPNTETAKVTFVDTPYFFVHEHNRKEEGKFFNFYTCIKEVDVCPMCEEGDKSSYVLAATIINHKPFEDREGNVHRHQKQLIVFKGKARDRMIRQLEKRDDIRFCVYEFHRGSGKTECGTGEDIEFVGRLKKEQLLKLVPEGFRLKEKVSSASVSNVLLLSQIIPAKPAAVKLQPLEQGSGAVTVKGPKEQSVETSVMVILRFPSETLYGPNVVADP